MKFLPRPGAALPVEGAPSIVHDREDKKPVSLKDIKKAVGKSTEELATHKIAD